MKKLISLFTALFLLMSTLPAQAGSPEISDLLTEYYKERQELPFGLTEEELTCVDGVLYGRDILLLYPKTRTDACFVIPDGIGYVWDFALAPTMAMATRRLSFSPARALRAATSWSAT